ncbi:hypothetical protein [Alicycliphilus denitrificans]|uniref:Uncharacterized protein n=1 Tax=Alicycliphilus denitrificans (strain DSM 14773 / CIP 107495 / K601) TaxID=596154 RepID=F4G5Q0_ALIDK|nr:hypothetical protein [Alicycliphilus denitrificans]AEB85307.1 hypothetical protein Alide2_2960 [Alicycliphilus denitrificans K601]
MPHAPSDFYRTRLAGLHQQLQNSPIARTYLTGTGIRFDGVDLMPDDQFELPFGSFSTVEFAHLFSVFDGSRVHQQVAKEPVRDAPPGLYFTVVNNHVIQSPHKNRLGIYTDQRGEADLFIDGLHVDHYFLNEHQTPPTLGTIAFALCAIAAHLAGLSQVSLVAAGGRGFGDQYVGYKVWPKLGFDAPLEPGEVAHVLHLAHCSTVQQVLAADPAWWEEQGSQRLMTFDLAADSTSWQKLLPYVSRKLSHGRLP